MFSGVLNLPHQDMILLQKKAEAIGQRCGQIYRGGVVKPEYAASDIAAILERLDKLVPQKPSCPTVVLADERGPFPATQKSPAVAQVISTVTQCNRMDRRERAQRAAPFPC